MDHRCLLLCLAQIVFSSCCVTNRTTCDCIETGGCISANCHSRGLAVIPKQQFNNTRICDLNLSSNKIYALQEDDFLRYPNLTSLDLSFNQISFIEKSAFVGLEQLISLDLAGNILSSFIIPDVLVPLTSLQRLNITVMEIATVGNTGASRIKPGAVNKAYSDGLPVKYLSLSGSYIKHLPRDILDNFRQLEYLNISSCRMETVEPGALSSLSNLHTLDVSRNRRLGFLGVQNITTGLHNSKLRNLLMNQIVQEDSICITFPKTLALNLQTTPLYMLEANANRIEIFHEDVFSLLPKTLQRVTIQSSRFTYGSYLHNLQNLSSLKYLDLSIKSIGHQLRVTDYAQSIFFEWSSICDGDYCMTHALSHEAQENGSENILLFEESIKDKDNILCLGIPPNLTTFKLTNHRLSFDLSKMCFKDNRLRHIDLSNNVFTVWTGPILGLENVSKLNLSGNSAKYISPYFFSTFKSLTHLDLSHNSFGFPNNRCKDKRYFYNQHKLEYLNLSHNDIFLLHRDFLTGLKSIKILDLSYNSIFNLSFNFEHNIHLQDLNCAYNNIKSITPHVRSQMKLLPDLKLDLSYNGLLCTCETIDFLDWLFSSKIASNVHNLYCVDKDRNRLSFRDHGDTILTNLKASCNSFLGMTLGVLTSLVFLLFLMSSVVCYRCRWKIIYWYYVVKLKLRNNRKEYVRLFDFDVYVSYADLDLGFVRSDMIQILEHLHGARLYIRDRDSLPGAPISENIIDGIRRSRKTVLLMSQAFLKKKWCRYELHMANMEAVSTGRSVMVVVMLEDIPNDDIPLEILYDFQRSRFLEYPKASCDLELFWSNVTAAIDSI